MHVRFARDGSLGRQKTLCVGALVMVGSIISPGIVVHASPAKATLERAKVELFLATDCPISNVYAPEIKRIIAKYSPEHVAFTVVYSDPTVTVAAVKKHRKDYGYTCPYVIDRSLKTAHQCGATVTPEAVVLTPNGKVIYRGRIDNLYASLGVQREQATVHDLRNVLDTVISRKPHPLKTTIAIGCYIPDA